MEFWKNGERDVVSVVVTTFNSASTVREVLDALLRQEYPLERIEVVVVDGHSSDDTLKVVEEFRNMYGKKFHGFKVITHERNLGVSRARNDGIRASRGEYILILDSDVVLPPNAVREMVEYLKRNPSVGCCVLLCKPDASSVILRWRYEVDYGRNRCTLAATGAALLKRGILGKTGLYNESLGPPFSANEDLEFGARIWRAGYKVVQLGNVIAHHLTERQKRYLKRLMGKDEREGRITTISLLKIYVGYLGEKFGSTWLIFLKSLPLRIRFRFIYPIAFLPLGLLLIAGLAIKLADPIVPTTTFLLIAMFLDVLRDYYNPRQIHKSCVLALAALVNRSIKCLSVVVYIAKASYRRRVKE